MNARIFKKLLEISRKMAEVHSLDSLLEYAVRVALDLFQADYGYLALVQEDDTLDFRVCIAREGVQLEKPVEPFHQRIIAQTIQNLETKAFANNFGGLDDPGTDPGVISHAAAICAPLLSQENVLGAVCIEFESKDAQLDETDIKILSYFADQVAVYVGNAIRSRDLEVRAARRAAELNQTVEQLEREIAERKRAEDQLRKLSRAVEQSPSTVVITNTEGQIEYVNPTFTNLTGYTLEEALGENPSILKSGATPPDTYVELWNTIKSGNVWRGEFINRKKNGENYWELAVIAPIRDSNGVTTHYVAIKEDITSRKQAEEELQKLAITDPLTNAFNRRHFFSLAEQALRHAQRYDSELSVAMIDLDYFKLVNDRYGHLIGDEVLKEIAGHIRRNIRKVDILGRYGGEEFIIVMPETPHSASTQVARRLLEYVRNHPVETKKGVLPITISLGLSSFIPEVDQTIDTLINKADQALYMAKQSGRNRVSIWQEN